jgi:predicted PurR-regulated permease PerM
MARERLQDPMTPPPTPIVITPRTRTIILLAIVAGFIILWRSAPTAVTILLGGLTLAVFLSTPVNLLSRIMPRGLAVLCTFLILLLIGVVIGTILVPLLIQQLTAFTDSVPEVATTTIELLRNVLTPLSERRLLDGTPDDIIDSMRISAINRLQLILEAIVSNLVGVLSNVAVVLFQLSIMVFIATYLLANISQVQSTIVAMAPFRYRPDVRQLLTNIGRSISRYLAGLLVSAADQGILSAVALTIIGVPYALLLGALMGIMAFLPYVGFWLATIAVVAVALTQSFTMTIIAFVAVVLINIWDSNFVLPRVQGQALRVSPLITTLAVIAFGEVFGPLGAVLALPFVGVLRALYDFFVERLEVERPEPTVVLTAPAPVHIYRPKRRLMQRRRAPVHPLARRMPRAAAAAPAPDLDGPAQE